MKSINSFGCAELQDIYSTDFSGDAGFICSRHVETLHGQAHYLVVCELDFGETEACLTDFFVAIGSDGLLHGDFSGIPLMEGTSDEMRKAWVDYSPMPEVKAPVTSAGLVRMECRNSFLDTN